MAGILAILLRWLLAPLFLAAAAACLASLAGAAGKGGAGVPPAPAFPVIRAGALVIGVLVFRFCWGAFLRGRGKEDPLLFLDTLEHELTHALFGFLTLSPPSELTATLRSGGEVTLPRANPLSVLAPYFFPLWTSALLPLGFLLRPEWLDAWRGLVFATAGNFLFRLFSEFRWRQSDLHRYGFLFSLAFVALGLVLVLALVLQVTGMRHWDYLAEAPGRLWEWLEEGWRRGKNL